MKMNEKNKERIKRTQAKLDNKNLFPIHHRIQLDVVEFIDISDLKANELMNNKEFIRNKMTMTEESFDGIIDLLEDLGFSPLRIKVESKQFEKSFLSECENDFLFNLLSKGLKEAFKDTDIDSLSREEFLKKIDEAREISLASL